MIALKRVLVATDFSESSEAALDYGRHFARTFGATLHVLHIVENVMARFAADAYPMVLPDLQRDLEDAGEKRLQAALTDDDRRTIPIVAEVRVSAAPSAAIVEYAKEAGIDLIIMGTHGRGPVARVFMGSVAERVVRSAPCPVLTVRHPERDFIVPDALMAVAKE